MSGDTDTEDGHAFMSVEDWNQRWNEGNIGFHESDIHRSLLKYQDRLFEGREKIKVFVPLCGKSVDMKWLLDQGHSVVGVEGTTQAIEEFFQEHHIKYSTSPSDDVKGILYKSEDDRVHLYKCDLFNFSRSVEGQFDAIWDRGSLVAINKADRKRYAELMTSLMDTGTRYLVETVMYDATKYGDTPHDVSDEVLMMLFGNNCNVEKLEEVDAMSDVQRDEWKLESFVTKEHLITLKIG